MAAAFFDQLADHTKAHAVSAGTEPGTRVHPEVLEVMREVGIDLSKEQPQNLTQELAEGASLLVTMGCGEKCPYVPGLRRDDWPLSDPKGRFVRVFRPFFKSKEFSALDRECRTLRGACVMRGTARR